MTEIQWLCDILTSTKLPPKIRDRFIARIGEISAPPNFRNTQVQGPTRPITPDTIPVLAQPHLPVQIKSEIDKETGRAVVSNGDGTRGPRKF